MMRGALFALERSGLRQDNWPLCSGCMVDTCEDCFDQDVMRVLKGEEIVPMKIPPINVYAFTAPEGSTPDFISINEATNGGVTCAVRALGNLSSIELTAEQCRELGHALIKRFP